MQRQSAPVHLLNPFLCRCRSCLRLRLRHFRQRNHSRHRLAGSWCCRCPKTEAAGRRPSRLTLEPGRRRLLLPADGISAWRSKCKSAVEGSILGLRGSQAHLFVFAECCVYVLRLPCSLSIYLSVCLSLSSLSLSSLLSLSPLSLSSLSLTPLSLLSIYLLSRSLLLPASPYLSPGLTRASP